ELADLEAVGAAQFRGATVGAPDRAEGELLMAELARVAQLPADDAVERLAVAVDVDDQDRPVRPAGREVGPRGGLGALRVVRDDLKPAGLVEPVDRRGGLAGREQVDHGLVGSLAGTEVL